nr:PREDICTED: transmembrane protein 222 [Lepisosteus oculatus]
MADVHEADAMKNFHGGFDRIDADMCRFPYCIVWTPIPVLSYLLPFIGHMGICTSTGVIRDFAGPYFVSVRSDCRCEVLSKAFFPQHNLCCDNCHSHVAMALNLMRYDNSTSWNMVKLCILFTIYSKHISCVSFLKTWLPFVLVLGIVLTVALALNMR